MECACLLAEPVARVSSIPNKQKITFPIVSYAQKKHGLIQVYM